MLVCKAFGGWTKLAWQKMLSAFVCRQILKMDWRLIFG
jgi:hypothetical protein